MAIALFDNWEIGYTSKGGTGWRTIRYAKYFIKKQPYFLEVFVDAVLHKKLLVAIDIYGVVFSWRMDDDEVTITYGEYPYVRIPAKTIFYLTKSPYDDIILIVVQGHGEALENPYYQVLKSEHKQVRDGRMHEAVQVRRCRRDMDTHGCTQFWRIHFRCIKLSLPRIMEWNRA
jgi:hypothetical protein